MVLDLQYQQPQPQPLHVAAHYTAKGGDHHHCIIAGRRHSDDQTFRKRRNQYFEKTMSRRNGAKLDLKLNLSPPRANRPRVESPSRSQIVSPTSPTSSCVSSELNQQDEEATSMMLVGCPRCLMYVMLAEEDPKCPKCKSSVLLDIIQDTTTSRKTNKS